MLCDLGMRLIDPSMSVGSDMDDITSAISIACKAHLGQTDKGGNPYILHPIRLMMKFAEPKKMIVAVLHDVVEDGDVSLQDLRKSGFSEEVVAAIDCLSKRPGEAYDDFISRVLKNELARCVKLEDIRDNMDLSRLPAISGGDMTRITKYHEALQRLMSVK